MPATPGVRGTRSLFRVVPAPAYLANFASDRRHMRRGDRWLAPPPPQAPIRTPARDGLATLLRGRRPDAGPMRAGASTGSRDCTHNLPDYLCTDPGRGPGTLVDMAGLCDMFAATDASPEGSLRV